MEQFKFPPLNFFFTLLRHLAASRTIFIRQEFEVKNQSQRNEEMNSKLRKAIILPNTLFYETFLLTKKVSLSSIAKYQISLTFFDDHALSYVINSLLCYECKLELLFFKYIGVNSSRLLNSNHALNPKLFHTLVKTISHKHPFQDSPRTWSLPIAGPIIFLRSARWCAEQNETNVSDGKPV